MFDQAENQLEQSLSNSGITAKFNTPTKQIKEYNENLVFSFKRTYQQRSFSQCFDQPIACPSNDKYDNNHLQEKREQRQSSVTSNISHSEQEWRYLIYNNDKDGRSNGSARQGQEKKNSAKLLSNLTEIKAQIYNDIGLSIEELIQKGQSQRITQIKPNPQHIEFRKVRIEKQNELAIRKIQEFKGCSLFYKVEQENDYQKDHYQFTRLLANIQMHESLDRSQQQLPEKIFLRQIQQKNAIVSHEQANSSKYRQAQSITSVQNYDLTLKQPQVKIQQTLVLQVQQKQVQIPEKGQFRQTSQQKPRTSNARQRITRRSMVDEDSQMTRLQESGQQFEIYLYRQNCAILWNHSVIAGNGKRRQRVLNYHHNQRYVRLSQFKLLQLTRKSITEIFLSKQSVSTVKGKTTNTGQCWIQGQFQLKSMKKVVYNKLDASIFIKLQGHFQITIDSKMILLQKSTRMSNQYKKLIDSYPRTIVNHSDKDLILKVKIVCQ